jgi:hypothetical protein
MEPPSTSSVKKSLHIETFSKKPPQAKSGRAKANDDHSLSGTRTR